MKIFVIPSWYKNDTNPGNCIFIYEQVVGLSKRGHQLVVLSPQLVLNPLCDNRIDKQVDGESQILYKKYWGLWPSRFPKQNIRSFKKCIDTLYNEAISLYGEPDVIYAHFSNPAGYNATKLGKEKRIPVVVEEHLSDLMQEQWPPYRRTLMTRTVNDSHRFICVSEGLKNAIEGKIGVFDNMTVISNMINPCFQFYPSSNDHFVYLSIGSLIPRKGFDLLIKAFANVFKGMDVELKIAGEGGLKESLEKLITTLGVEKQVILLGQLSREETLNQYRNCNCFVLTSKAETFGLVYREALAVGRPIISTKHGGFSDKDWHKEYGFLINYGDQVELEKSLTNIYSNFKNYDLQLISKLCLSTCSEETVLSAIEKELEMAVKGNK